MPTEEQIIEKRARPVLTNENRESYMAIVKGFEPPKEPVAVADPKASEPKAEEPKTEAKTEPKIEPKVEEPKEAKPQSSFQDRISEVVHQRNEARELVAAEKKRAEDLERRLKELTDKTAPPAPEGKPRPDLFADPIQYAEALASWSAKEAIKAHDMEQRARVESEAKAKQGAEWNARHNAFKAATPEYEAVVAASDIMVSDEIRDAIWESDQGPQLLYHLAMHPELGRKLATMSRTGALRELGKIEGSLSAPAPKPEPVAVAVSQAPTPINPVKGATPVESPYNASGEFVGSYADWKAARKSGKIR